jgi:chorismate synthase
MPQLDYITAGESHGPGVVAIVSGMPADVAVDVAFIDAELSRRQGGYGRGARQRIEQDRVEILAGVRGGRGGRTTGAPVLLRIANKDSRLEDAARTPPVFRPRPGHADLAGSVKFLTTDCRNILERASARETAARTAAGALARCMLRELDVEAFGFVRSIGGGDASGTRASQADASGTLAPRSRVEVTPENWRELRDVRDRSETFCIDEGATEQQIREIHQAKVERDTVGGVCEVHVFGCPMGLGSCMDWRDRLDTRLAAAAMSIQAMKGVEIGMGMEVAQRRGSQVHDPIEFERARCEERGLGFVRPSNNAGGIEGGMSNGMPIVVRAAMKPISTLLRGMPSVDLNTKEAEGSAYERSDVCAVPAASVVLENVAAFEIARAVREKFGGDSMMEVRANLASFLKLARMLPIDPPDMTIA